MTPRDAPRAASPLRHVARGALPATVLAAILTVVALIGCNLPTLTSIGEVQGAGHTSPLVGQQVTVRGIVVAEGNLPSADPRTPDVMVPGCWIEDEDDGDPATSRGLLVTGASAQVGRAVRVTGTVVELGAEPDLTVTSLAATELVEEGDGTTPEPVVLGDGGRAVPADWIDDDGVTRFEPESDGLDFWESLEGMRVRVREPLVVGATKRDSLYVVASGGRGAGPRTSAGGLRLTDQDPNPERIQISGLLLGRERVPLAQVGETFAADIDGVVHYRRGHFELLPSSLPRVPRRRDNPRPKVPRREDGRLRVASLNVLNLSAADDARRFEGAAEMIVRDLGSPELVALQEVQDDTGPQDDGTVSAERTLRRLVDVVSSAGGPDYRWLQVDPKNNGDGGQPGGNIRVALLYDASRLAPASGDIAGLGSNPAVLDAPAFRHDGDDDWSPSRKPLVAHLDVTGSDASLYAVVLHLSSKGGDDSEWGAVQPPRRLSEAQRTEQAREVAGLVTNLVNDEPNARVVVLGDLNEYPFRPPLLELEKAGLTNLVKKVPEEDRYTYVYRGNSIVLDHILVTPALAKGAEVVIVHRNADIPAARQASDHDPIVASLPLRGSG